MTDTAATNVDDLAFRGLTATQERALPLLVSGMSPRQVAAEVGVSWGTLRNWCSQNDRFKAALAQLRREAHQHALAGVHSLAEGAVAALRDILTKTTTTPRERIAAAQTVLRHALPVTSNHVLTTPESAAAQIAAILDQLETDDDGQDHP